MIIAVIGLAVIVVAQAFLIVRLTQRTEYLRERLLKQMRVNSSLKMMKRQREYIVINEKKIGMPIEMTEVKL